MLDFLKLHIIVSAISDDCIYIHLDIKRRETLLSIGIIRADSFVVTARTTCMEEE